MSREVPSSLIQPLLLHEKGTNLVLYHPNYFGYLAGCIETDDPEAAYIDLFYVNPALQGNGLGKHFLKTLAQEAKQRDLRYLQGSLISAAAFMARGKVFGFESLDLKDNENNPVNLSAEEILKEYSLHDPEDDEDDFIYRSRVDLAKVDTTTWPRAIPTAVPFDPLRYAIGF